MAEEGERQLMFESDRDQKKKYNDKTGLVSVILLTLTLIGITVALVLIIQKTKENSPDTSYVEFMQSADVIPSYLKQNFKNSPLAQRIKMEVYQDSENELTIKIKDADNSGFELPEDSIYLPSNKKSAIKGGQKNYEVELRDNYVKVWRLVDGKRDSVIFDTSSHKLIVSKHYTQFGTDLNSKYLYGLGERRKEFRYRGTGNYTTWPKDQFMTFQDDKPSKQLYGYHPMWLSKENNGKYFVGFLKSTSALLTEITEGQQMIFHVVGGNIVLKFFLGDENPENVIKAYHRYINGYYIHPFWAQGYHNSRWGYNKSTDLVEAIDNFNKFDHPIDSIWNDLDYMDSYKDFTLSKDYKPADIQKVTDRSTGYGVHWVPLMDIGIAVDTYADTIGQQMDIFMKSSVFKGKLLEGCVWPGNVHFPDFNHPKAGEYWTKMANYTRDTLKVVPTGYWIDMSELASFANGERDQASNQMCPPANPTEPVPTFANMDDRLFVPVSVAGGNPLSQKTATLTAKHYVGDDALLIKKGDTTEQYFHSLNNLAEQIRTDETLQEFTGKKLTFSLTRASIYGSGRYTTHWTGDNGANWDFLRLAVSELLPFQFFGIPMTGNDICGFAGNTNPELCAKWLALGAWEPFSRNHNDNVSIAQEPYQFDADHKYVLLASRTAFKTRYSLLKWMYSLFLANWEINEELSYATGTIIQPTWWYNNTDQAAFDNEDKFFFFGHTFYIAPVLTQSSGTQLANEESTLSVYFPSGSNYWNYQGLATKEYFGGSTTTFTRKFSDEALYFQKQGTLFFKQTPQNRARLLDNHFKLFAYLDKNEIAEGKIMTLTDYEENNVHKKCMSTTDCIAKVSITLNSKTSAKIQFAGVSDTTVYETIIIDEVNIVYGAKLYTKAVTQTIKGDISFDVILQ